MMKRALLTALFSIVACVTAQAQNLCPNGTKSDKLVCLIPQVYGPNGLVLPGGPSFPSGASPQFDFAGSSLQPINSAIVNQAALLPLTSPSSGISFTWDSAAKVFTSSTESFGPILAERAETIGKSKVFVGFDYQYFKFGSFDGISLKNLPTVFTQPDNSAAVGTTCSVNGNNIGDCAFIRDVIKVNNSIDMKIHEFITLVTFGLTNRIDVSAAIPIENVRMGIVSDATIVNVSNSPFHAFNNRPGCGTATTNCLNQQFSNVATASGIGDIILRLKGIAWKGERAGLALGVDVRTPTGDSLNYLGSGAPGVRPFIGWSYRAWLSPHVSAGYEVNGSSKIAGDISTGTKERLPSQLTYAGGVDMPIAKRFTLAVDLVGQYEFQVQRLSRSTFTELGACTQQYPNCAPPFLPPNTDPSLSESTRTLNVVNVSVGAKFRPFSNLLITGNVLVKVNDGGLRSTAVPLGGISYTF